MRKRTLILLAIILGTSFVALSQAKTKPYFQQDLKYKIEVRLDDTKHQLKGVMELDYTNHSSDTLYRFPIHLWANAFKDNSSAFAKQQLEDGKTDYHYSKDSLRGWIDSMHFVINNVAVTYTLDQENIDIAYVGLPKPVLPGESIHLKTPFVVQMPYCFSRIGHDAQQYQVTQWYPKPAVYDREGWHPIPYLDQGEFYAEFATYDVQISLPKNYIVGATGDLQDSSEIKFLHHLADSNRTIDAYDKDLRFPISDTEFKTLHYHAENVTDFAWFADKRYNVLRGEVLLPNSGRKVETWLYFTNKQAKLWKDQTHVINDAIRYYSAWVGDYKYNAVTAVEGALKAGGGMEYPMITVIGGVSSESELETVIVHEVGHNWFQGMLGSNERVYPWMDEGINSYYEKRYTELKHQVPQRARKGFLKMLAVQFKNGFNLSSASFNGNTLNYLAYLYNARLNRDQATGERSEVFTTLNYFSDVYAKTPLLFNYLAATLGQDSFDHIMQQYFNEWSLKHPYPTDIREVFLRNNPNLTWFFDQLIPTNEKIDMHIHKVLSDTIHIGNSAYYKVLVDNNNPRVRTPYTIEAIQKDSVVRSIPYGGFLGRMDVLFPYGTYDRLQIDANYTIPEVNRQNNSWYFNKYFHRSPGFAPRPVLGIENPNVKALYLAPAIMYNQYDGWQVGLAFYNHAFPNKAFEFECAPVFGTRSKQFGGLYRVSYSIPLAPNKYIETVRPILFAKRFTESSNLRQYTVLRPSIVIIPKNPNPRNKITERYELSATLLGFGSESKLEQTVWNPSPIFALTYQLENPHVFHPWNLYFRQEIIGLSSKSWAALEGKFVLNSSTSGLGSNRIQIKANQKRSLHYRLFAGYVTKGATLQLSNFNGQQDYRYDQYFVARTAQSGFWSHQVLLQEGGFTAATPLLINQVGISNSWMSTLRLAYDLPVKAPLQVYGTIGYFESKFKSVNKLQYEAGIAFHIGTLVQVYLPIWISSDFEQYYNKLYSASNLPKNLLHRISFSLDLKSLDVFEMTRTINF
ncbi:MAG: hypothetical protein RL138_1348 [Bacteroidota bacterium]